MIRQDSVRASEGTAGGAGPVGAVLALFGAAAIVGAGTLAWNGGALGGFRGVGYEAPAGMALLGFLIGAGAFFAPCAFVLFPAYASFAVAVRPETICASLSPRGRRVVRQPSTVRLRRRPCKARR